LGNKQQQKSGDANPKKQKAATLTRQCVLVSQDSSACMSRAANLEKQATTLNENKIATVEKHATSLSPAS
jgi:uncharacterized membrane protein